MSEAAARNPALTHMRTLLEQAIPADAPAAAAAAPIPPIPNPFAPSGMVGRRKADPGLKVESTTWFF